MVGKKNPKIFLFFLGKKKPPFCKKKGKGGFFSPPPKKVKKGVFQGKKNPRKNFFPPKKQRPKKKLVFSRNWGPPWNKTKPFFSQKKFFQKRILLFFLFCEKPKGFKGASEGPPKFFCFLFAKTFFIRKREGGFFSVFFCLEKLFLKNPQRGGAV